MRNYSSEVAAPVGGAHFDGVLDRLEHTIREQEGLISRATAIADKLHGLEQVEPNASLALANAAPQPQPTQSMAERMHNRINRLKVLNDELDTQLSRIADPVM